MKNRFLSNIGTFFLILTLIGFLLLFSNTTSPFFDNTYGIDSAWYRYFGLSILQGRTPYIDIWENKGPVLYFIEALGAINGTQNQKISFIFLMQTVSLISSVLLLKHADSIINPSEKNKFFRFFLFTTIGLSIFGITIEGGNLTEEWSIPMICCSLYYFIKYAYNDNGFSKPFFSPSSVYHPEKYAFIHGICFSTIAFIRINNAVSICSGLIIIGLHLAIHKQWKNLFKNILFGILGIGVIALPVFVWYLSKHALGEMLYTTFLHGIKYTEIYAHKNITCEMFLIGYLPVILCFFLIFLHLIRNRIFRIIDGISLAVITSNLLLLYKCNKFFHYFTILIPVFLFMMIVYIKRTYSFEFFLFFALFLYTISICKQIVLSNINNDKTYLFPTAITCIPKSERNSMIAIDTTPEIYLIKGMVPCSRFASYQKSLFGIEPEFEEEFLSDIKEAKPKWIIVRCREENDFPYIKQLLASNYSINFSESNYCFYRMNVH